MCSNNTFFDKKRTFGCQIYFAIMAAVNIIENGLAITTLWKIPITIVVSQYRLLIRPNFKPYKTMKNAVEI